MSESIKFSEEEITEIKQVQTNYQKLGLDLVQIKLAVLSAKNQLEAFESEEKMLTERILELNESLFNVSTISSLVLNLIDTVSFGFSSVYKRRPDPLGFLPVPFLGSASSKPLGVFSFLPVLASIL